LAHGAGCAKTQARTDQLEAAVAPAPMNASHKDSTGVHLFVKEIGAVGRSRANERNKCPICGYCKELNC